VRGCARGETGLARSAMSERPARRERERAQRDPVKLGEELLAEAAAGNLKRVKKLIGLGADPNFVDKKVWAARPRIARRQRRSVDARAALTIGLFANSRLSARARSQRGEYTALIKAARMQRLEVVQFLLASKADPNKASRNKWTPLIEAW
jgi:ankyrin repeat protein